MKLKNTLGVVIGSLLASASVGAFAQGPGAVEIEGFVKKEFYKSSRDFKNDGILPGGSVGVFVTDGVELRLAYDEVHNARGDNGRNIKGSDTALDVLFHFNDAGDWFRPYLSSGLAHQSIGQGDRGGRNHTTFVTLGGGFKWYFTDNFYARTGVEAQYSLDQGTTEWAPSIGVGINFGGTGKPAAPVVAAVEPVPEVVEAVEESVEIVRVELDVKFDFDKSVVKQDSYADIKNVADFMNQYPQTTTVVEGYTDSVGTDAYNLKLSERRATAVRNVLVDQYGVGADRVSSVGYGESNPIADNATEAGRAINRRVEAAVEATVGASAAAAVEVQ